MTRAQLAPFRLISQGWDAEIQAAGKLGPGSLLVICPFIKANALDRLLSGRRGNIRVLTRFDLNCFNEGVSDIESLRQIIRAGGAVRGIKHLHSKLYLFGGRVAIATSANVTDAGFRRNHEFGFVATDADVLRACEWYFEDLWKPAGNDLTASQIDRWEEKLKSHQRKGGNAAASAGKLPDYGTDVGLQSPYVGPIGQPAFANQAFLKFFGTSGNRASRNLSIAEMIEENGCNWACTYPESKPPRQVHDGDIIYMARMVDDDMLIFGKAIGLRHRDDQDIASKADIKLRRWKENWPRYVRVHDGRFIDATLADGVSFHDMLTSLGADAFASTQRNKLSGEGNTNPFESHNRKAHMMLTDESRVWLDMRLEAALAAYGEVDLTPSKFRPPY